MDFKAGNISNDSVEEVVFENPFGKQHTEKIMHPSNDFTDVFNGALGVKINSIVRQDRPMDSEVAVYTLRFVIRRKRWN